MSIATKPDFQKIEKNILEYWDTNKSFEKLREKNKNKKLFRFLDGPITAILWAFIMLGDGLQKIFF